MYNKIDDIKYIYLNKNKDKIPQRKMLSIHSKIFSDNSLKFVKIQECIRNNGDESIESNTW